MKFKNIQAFTLSSVNTLVKLKEKLLIIIFLNSKMLIKYIFNEVPVSPFASERT
jgi:hypothetical protein